MTPSARDYALKTSPFHKEIQSKLSEALKKELPTYKIKEEQFIDASHFFDLGNNKNHFIPEDEYYPLKEFLKRFENGQTLTYYIKTYWADICINNKFVIEIDGITHSSRKQEIKDMEKDELLQELNYKVLRVKDSELLSEKKLKETISKIKEML